MRGAWRKTINGLRIMRTIFKQPLAFLLSLYILLLPWQTAYIFDERIIGGIKSQYLSGVFYVSEIVLLSALFLSVIGLMRTGKFSLKDWPRRLRQADPKRRNFICALWLFIGWIGLSILWSPDKLAALYQFRFFLEGAALMLIVLKDRISLNTIFTALFISAILPAVLAIYQFLSQDIAACKWLGLAAHQAADSGTIVIEAGGRWLRAYGPFSHPNILGGWLSLSFLSGLIVLADSKVNTYMRRAITFAGPLLVAGMFFSFSRSAWLSLIICVVLFIYFKRDQFRLKNVRAKIFYPAPQLFYSLIFFLILAALYSPLLLARADSGNRLENISSTERLDQYQEARELFALSPLSGTGLNNYTVRLMELFPDRPVYALQPVHNIYFLLVAELGLIGLILFLALLIFGWQYRSGLRLNEIYAVPLILILIIGLLDHYFYTSYIGIILASLFLSAAISTVDNKETNC